MCKCSYTGVFGWMILWILFSHAALHGQKIKNASQAGGKPAEREFLNRVHLQELNGNGYTLSALSKKLTAFVFLSPECPLCQNYSLVLNKLQNKYSDDLTIVGVFPGQSGSLSDCQAFSRKYMIHFLLLRDTLKGLVKILGGRVTPEVFLLDREWNILYRGAIDNWAVALGKQRKKATENYLEDGITSLLNGKAVIVKETKPIGCFINEY